MKSRSIICFYTVHWFCGRRSTVYDSPMFICCKLPHQGLGMGLKEQAMYNWSWRLCTFFSFFLKIFSTLTCCTSYHILDIKINKFRIAWNHNLNPTKRQFKKIKGYKQLPKATSLMNTATKHTASNPECPSLLSSILYPLHDSMPDPKDLNNCIKFISKFLRFGCGFRQSLSSSTHFRNQLLPKSEIRTGRNLKGSNYPHIPEITYSMIDQRQLYKNYWCIGKFCFLHEVWFYKDKLAGLYW